MESNQVDYKLKNLLGNTLIFSSLPKIHLHVLEIQGYWFINNPAM